MTGYTSEREVGCGKEEHTHKDDCYITEEVLVCGQGETEEHVHGEGCRQAQQILTCVAEEHIHADECYKEVTTTEVAATEATTADTTITDTPKVEIVTEEIKTTEVVTESIIEESVEEHCETTVTEANTTEQVADTTKEDTNINLNRPKVVLQQKIEDDIIVILEADEGVLPEGVTMKVVPVKDKEYEKAVEEEL